MNITILRPGQVFLNETTDKVILPSSDGQFGVLPGHCPLITSFASGFLSLGGTKYQAFDGFVKIQNDRILVLCRSIEAV